LAAPAIDAAEPFSFLDMLIAEMNILRQG